MADNITLASRKVQLLLFADDLVLLADSSKGLQDSLYWLTGFCKTWKLNINTTKIKVVIFNRRRNIHQIPLILDNMELEYVSSYKYLGIIVSSNGSFKLAILLLQNRPARHFSHYSEQLLSYPFLIHCY